jgi:acetyl-CoA acyltransferase
VLLAGLPKTVGGVTVNRYCASGITALAMAADRIRVGEADAMIAGGVESMSMVPMMGHHPSMNLNMFTDENVGMAYGMGLTAEKVATQWKVSREAQDAFAVESHRRAIAAQQAGFFKDETTPVEIITRTPNLATGQIDIKTRTVDTDEGARADSTVESLAKLKPVFAAKGRDRRQLVADVRRRRRAAGRQREDPARAQPDPAGQVLVVRRARRAAGNHGHRS